MTQPHASFTDDRLSYLSGFGNEFASEALPGALPLGQNSPQRPAYGLYAEQLSVSAFTVPRRDQRRTWFYRIRPSALHGPFRPIEQGKMAGPLAPPDPNRLRWDPLPYPDAPTDFLAGLHTMNATAPAEAASGVSVHVYVANRSMERVFYDADGELLLVPQEGALRILTECGRLDVAPGEIALIPRDEIRRPAARGQGAGLCVRKSRRPLPASRSRSDRRKWACQSPRFRSPHRLVRGAR